MNEIFEIKNLVKKYKKTKECAVNDLSFKIYRGEILGIVGESGSGKSTLGKMLTALLPPTSGEIIYHGEAGDVDLAKLKGKELRKLRRDIQIVFQDPYSSLDPTFDVERIIVEGLEVNRIGSVADREKAVDDMMKKCCLTADMKGRKPREFSGGQRQRIAIARSIIMRPKFVVLDECVSALDVSVQAQIIDLLLKVKGDMTYLFISHDLNVVRRICDRVAVMYHGEIVEVGEVYDVFNRTEHEYTKELIACSAN